VKLRRQTKRPNELVYKLKKVRRLSRAQNFDLRQLQAGSLVSPDATYSIRGNEGREGRGGEESWGKKQVMQGGTHSREPKVHFGQGTLTGEMGRRQMKGELSPEKEG